MSIQLPSAIEEGEPTFGSSMWGIRLQAVWILFAAMYSLIADLAPQRPVSSRMILIAGVLLLAIFAHVIVSSDLERIRRMLLVTMAASLFVINTAFHGFKDYLAGGFAGCLQLCWRAWFGSQVTAFDFGASNLCKSRVTLMRDGLVMAIVAGFVEELVNRDRVDLLLSSSMTRFALSAAYIGIFVLPLAFALAELARDFVRGRLCGASLRGTHRRPRNRFSVLGRAYSKRQRTVGHRTSC